MDTGKLIAEARARITWGDEPVSVHDFLTEGGMPATDADIMIRDLMLERHAEIRRMGKRDVLIGVALMSIAGIFFYLIKPSNGHIFRVSYFKVVGLFGLAGAYGFWRLINGIIRLLRPKLEQGAISDVTWQ
jgi:hypothetical protein